MPRVSFFFLICLLVFTATAASAQSRHQPFKFSVTAIDADTRRPRSTFVLGEPVIVQMSLTNQSRVPRTVAQLPDTTIDLLLSSLLDYEIGPTVRDSYIGGTGYAQQSAPNLVFWGNRPPRMITIAPGQTVSKTFDLGRHLLGHPLQEGTHTLTAKYNSSLRASVSVRVVVDEAKSIPLLERLASEPVHEGRDTLQRWANISLELLRKPSITGHVRDAEGRPLKDIRILISGAENTNTATGHDGAYIVTRLKKGATYTITPEFAYYDDPGEIRYTLEPASKSVSIVNGKVTGVNFTATRVRASKNVASASEGAKVKASSAQNDDYEIDDTIDEMRFAHVWGYGSGGWNDATPNVFPDWIEVDFRGVRRINWINVFTLSDNYKDAPEPDLEQTFSRYGITDFDVEYWTGRSWRTVPGGAIRGNRNVWRMISFPVVATNKIRVVVRSGLGGASRITEIEAFHLNVLPQAKLVSITNALTHSAIHFRSAVSDRDGTIQHYELDFGDDTTPYKWSFDSQRAGNKPRLIHSHVFEKEGTYNVRLRVVDDSNEATEKTIVVTITDSLKRTTTAAQLRSLSGFQAQSD